MTKKRFIRLANNRLTMWLHLLFRLPMAWFAGIRVQHCDAQKTVVRLPYGWRSQNPFRSTYFAAECAAGELSTGLMALAHLSEKPPMSMLVTNIEAVFLKKASQTLLFTCEEGEQLAGAIDKALESGEAQTFIATSTGRLPDGSVAAVVKIHWSFKSKQGSRLANKA